MTILVPTDFSGNAIHAIDYALTLARAMEANLLLLHVFKPQVTRANVVYPYITEEIALLKNEAAEKLNEITSGIHDNYGVSCTTLVLVGNPVDEIIDTAKNRNVDLVVMGTQGASGIKKILFGSNTAAVIERATCPVLAVPEDAVIRLPQKIVFATDYQTSDMQILKGLASITSALKAELLLLHVAKEELRSKRDLIEDFSMAVAKEINIPQPYHYVMPNDDIRKGIDLFMKSVKADIIAMSTRKRNVLDKFFDASLTKKMAQQTHLPLLAFHSTVEHELA